MELNKDKEWLYRTVEILLVLMLTAVAAALCGVAARVWSII